jgi:hypothetical protein
MRDRRKCNRNATDGNAIDMRAEEHALIAH